MNILEFNSLPWHDAELLNIIIDRRRPGTIDKIFFQIRWPDQKENVLCFSGCYLVKIAMNFGVVAAETIRFAEALDECKEITELVSRWENVGVHLSNLKCFDFVTNSTNSNLKIIASECALLGDTLPSRDWSLGSNGT